MNTGWIREIKHVWLVVFCMAATVNGVVGGVLGLRHPMESDAFYFLGIAKSLAAGQGYSLADSFWPGQPTISRAPGWPLVISLALRLLPTVSPDLVMRCLALLLNSVVAVLVALLAKRLVSVGVSVIANDPGRDPIINSRSLPMLAGGLYIIHPTALYEAYNGMSEPLFLLLALSGAIQVLSSRRYDLWGGIFLLGLSALVRSNFILWIGFAGGIVISHSLYVAWMEPGKSVWAHRASRRAALRGAVMALLFIAPSFLWAVRNYNLTGHFPVLSTLRGQTFYGGNNSIVAESLDLWGYWIFPNSIPGETSMYQLSRTMSEYEVDVAYFDKGKEWVRNHLSQMPGLVLGKLIRAYCPVPWKLSAKGALIGLFRAVLYGFALWALVLYWSGLSLQCKVTLGAMMATNVATVAIFWGCARFAFELEPFLMPFAVVAGLRLFESMRNGRMVE